MDVSSGSPFLSARRVPVPVAYCGSGKSNGVPLHFYVAEVLPSLAFGKNEGTVTPPASSLTSSQQRAVSVVLCLAEPSSGEGATAHSGLGPAAAPSAKTLGRRMLFLDSLREAGRVWMAREHADALAYGYGPVPTAAGESARATAAPPSSSAGRTTLRIHAELLQHVTSIPVVLNSILDRNSTNEPDERHQQDALLEVVSAGASSSFALPLFTILSVATERDDLSLPDNAQQQADSDRRPQPAFLVGPCRSSHVGFIQQPIKSAKPHRLFPDFSSSRCEQFIPASRAALASPTRQELQLVAACRAEGVDPSLVLDRRDLLSERRLLLEDLAEAEQALRRAWQEADERQAICVQEMSALEEALERLHRQQGGASRGANNIQNSRQQSGSGAGVLSPLRSMLAWDLSTVMPSSGAAVKDTARKDVLMDTATGAGCLPAGDYAVAQATAVGVRPLRLRDD
jgi:hypothetical protein